MRTNTDLGDLDAVAARSRPRLSGLALAAKVCRYTRGRDGFRVAGPAVVSQTASCQRPSSVRSCVAAEADSSGVACCVRVRVVVIGSRREVVIPLSSRRRRGRRI